MSKLIKVKEKEKEKGKEKEKEMEKGKEKEKEMGKDKENGKEKDNLKKAKRCLPFYILLGHCDEITEQLGSEDEETQVILEDGAWILLKHQGKRLLWILDDELENLRHHFMMYRNPQILIFLNYHQKGIRTHLDEQFRKAMRIIKHHDQGSIRLVGFNYDQGRQKMKTLKKVVLEWCIEKEELEYTEYVKNDPVGELFEDWED